MNQKKTPYIVPDKYFDNLTSRIINRIQEEKKRPKLLVLLKPYIWLAALFIIAILFKFVLPYFISDNQQIITPIVATVPPLTGNEEITNEEIIEYILDDSDNYDALYAELYK